MLKPPYRPRKRAVRDPHAAEKAEQGLWPYVGGKGPLTKRPDRVSIDGKQIAAFRPGILVIAGDFEEDA